MRQRLARELWGLPASLAGALVVVGIAQETRPYAPFWLLLGCGALGSEAGYRVWRYWPRHDDEECAQARDK